MFGENNAAKTDAAQQTSAAPMPLFFKQPQVITLDRHRSAKLKGGITMEFSRMTNAVPLTVADIPEAAKHYPIGFSMEKGGVPVAIVGLEKENYFLDKEGNWLERAYVPSYVRRYPFIFTEIPDSDKLALCVDEETLTFNAKDEGTDLYEKDEAAPFTKQVLEFCTAYHDQHRLTVMFAQELADLGLLSPQRSDIKLMNGREIQLGGFQLIDQEKLSQLTDEQVLKLHKQGALALITYLNQSQTNWRALLELANGREK